MKKIPLVLVSLLTAARPCIASAHPTISLTPKEYVLYSAQGSTFNKTSQIAYTQGTADAVMFLANGTCPKMRYGEIGALTIAKIYELNKQENDTESVEYLIVLAMDGTRVPDQYHAEGQFLARHKRRHGGGDVSQRNRSAASADLDHGFTLVRTSNARHVALAKSARVLKSTITSIQYCRLNQSAKCTAFFALNFSFSSA